ncbi:MAG TPA: hypothetical protein VH063_13525 [Gaiellaceae bacterium]|jgi:hypothetical protein|nr:hypothetical protein [Gaiellaceae bacterium]
MSTLELTVERAVASAEDIRWVRGYLQGLVDGGLEREQLEHVLEHVYEHLRDAGNQSAADLALDGLDFLTGWCGPGMEIASPRIV